MILWTLNALRVLLWVLLYQLSSGQRFVICERVWNMSPDSHLPAGKTYEEWYGSFALDCTVDGHGSSVFCLGPNC
jgi:hypothetical protein